MNERILLAKTAIFVARGPETTRRLFVLSRRIGASCIGTVTE